MTVENDAMMRRENQENWEKAHPKTPAEPPKPNLLRPLFNWFFIDWQKD